MSSAGHVLDSINRMKQNKALKNARRNRYSKVRETYLKHATHEFKYIDNSNLTPDELRELKVNIRNKIIRERRTIFIKSIITTMIIAILITVWVLYF